jgi:hypothetical protein
VQSHESTLFETMESVLGTMQCRLNNDIMRGESRIIQEPYGQRLPGRLQFLPAV